MSILSGYGKFRRYVLTKDGYKLCSQWTSSNTVHFDDDKTAEVKLGAIDGITDSLTATNSNIALSSKAGKNLQNQINELNTGMDAAGSNISAISKALDNTKTRLNNLTNTSNIKGYLNAYKDDIHHVGISFDTYMDNTVPAIVIDDYKIFSLPNNLRNDVRGRIVDFYVDYNTSPWQLTIKVYIDGTIYTRAVPLQEV